ncbi:MAG: 3-methylornithyl-N6-L-lysine dehydrogenase PylD [Synergistaceae bacterium]|jgi:pyrrolysine biosynthesis protein PylD|nr:3-methylornithyl-N6-L-lysine dehydrogenase PylD [Synergistaceae bacterium]
MTRLTESDIAGSADLLEKYDLYLKELCGVGLAGIASAASKKNEILARAPRVAVIPITSGLGVINGFSETVAGIAGFLGFDARVTGAADIAGVAEAVSGQYDIIMAADDDTFIAVNLKKRLVSDNGEATGRGYATALSLASGGLRGKNVLMLGAGPVGRAAAETMLSDGAALTVFDIDRGKAESLRLVHPSVRIADNLADALSAHSLLFDATPVGPFIGKGALRDDAILSAPGVPLCLDAECEAWMRGRLLHDALEIGVATMLFDVL